jgi:arylsulfatase A-like enzyme
MKLFNRLFNMEINNRTRIFAVSTLTLLTAVINNSCQSAYPVNSPQVSDLAKQAARPNILVILSDDQGYADVGFQGCKDIPTPNLDRLAAQGVICTDGYVTHPYSSPSRAGLMTGRYQMRIGHEFNPEYNVNDHSIGLSLTEKLLPQFLKEAGYTTGWIGKWHLGAAPEFSPENRGFQETFGFLGGGHNYIDYDCDTTIKSSGPVSWQHYSSEEYNSPILRNGKPVEVKEHLTVAFGHEAAAFINRHPSGPWFLYLAFNAPHMPNQPTYERFERFNNIKNMMRRRYAAQVSLMDDAIGEAMEALRKSGQLDNTLIFFFSDNGGQIYNGADNAPLRDKKGTVFEGGVRVPFVVCWPKQIPGGRNYDQIVSSLDVFSTSMACAGIPMPTDKQYDGVDLVPFLRGDKPGNPHEQLFWRETEAGQWGVRDGDWKLVWRTIDLRSPGGKDITFPEPSAQIFNLTEDNCERLDYFLTQQEKVKKLKSMIDEWEKQSFRPALAPPQK